MKICKAIQEKKKQKQLIQLKNSLIQQIQEINVKIESLESLLARLDSSNPFSVDATTESLILECHRFYIERHRQDLQSSHYLSLRHEWEIERALSEYQKQAHFLAELELINQGATKTRKLPILKENFLFYISELQASANGCVSNIFKIDQHTAEDAYISYLESLKFSIDIIQEIPEGHNEQDLIEPEASSDILANLSLEDLDF